MPSKPMKFIANLAAFLGPTRAARRKIRQSILGTPKKRLTNNNVSINHRSDVVSINQFSEVDVLARAQDFLFPIEITKTKRLMVIVVPEHNDMSGGIYSFFSIAKHMYAMRHIHGYDVLVMTRPNPTNHTYLRLSAFRNAETVYRFDQIQLCDQVEDLYLHIPEYATPFFCDLLSPDLLRYLKNRKKLYINIMNQNVELMPAASEFEDLRQLATELTQSVAHHAYFGQEFADRYNLPTLLLPAYTDLSAYPASTFEQKRKLIIYSLDKAPHKQACLEILEREFSDYERVEIRGISFDRYMQLATDCMFSISFGEGFDGYVAQPIQQGGIGLTVYREEFFPSNYYLNCYNIFSSEEEMVAELATRMRRMATDANLYKSVNEAYKQEHDKLYSFDDYISRVRRLSVRDFDLFPMSAPQLARCRSYGHKDNVLAEESVRGHAETEVEPLVQDRDHDVGDGPGNGSDGKHP